MSVNYQNEILCRLELLLLPGMSPRRLRRLRDCFGNAADIFLASVRDISVGADIPLELSQSIVSRKARKDAEKELEKVEKLGIKLIPDFSAEFPTGLKDLSDCPILIYCRGKDLKEIFSQPAVAIVGTRRPTEYGRKVVRDFVSKLSAWQVVTVSGLARGIDTEVHFNTLENAGRTVAFVGCGLDIIYPPENKKLFQEVSEKGAVISEFPLGVPPSRENFPRRNRLIASASLATLVIEATADSGAIITARLAAELGREVMAVPGSIYSETSAGSNRLLKEGAHLLTAVEDICDILYAVKQLRDRNFSSEKQSVSQNHLLTSEQNDIINILRESPEGLSVNSLCQRLKISQERIFSELLNLELKGLVLVRPGNVYVLK